MHDCGRGGGLKAAGNALFVPLKGKNISLQRFSYLRDIEHAEIHVEHVDNPYIIKQIQS